MTRIGVVAHPDRYAAVGAAGADYLEPTLVGGLVQATADGWSPGATLPGDMRAPGFCILFPGHLTIGDPAFPREPIRDHLERTFAHIAPWAEQGATIVLGSGAARRTPSGVSREAAAASLADVARMGDDIAKRYGYELLLEPLNSSETDQINGFAEGVAFLDAHGLDDMRLVCDWYHLVLGGEGLDDVVPHVDRVGHVHLAETDRRVAPGAGEWPLESLVRGLLDAGYSGNVSIECNWADFDAEAPDAVALVRSWTE